MKRNLTDEERYRLFWREVVYQAMRDLFSPETTSEDREDALEWVCGDSVQPGSFLWACVEGGVSAKALHEELAKRGIIE